MKRNKKLLLFLIPLCLILLGVFLRFLPAILLSDFSCVSDRSAVRAGDGVYWNNVYYGPCSGIYSEGKTFAKTEDGLNLNEANGDKTHTFIVMRSFLDQYLLVREDYEIPQNGEITLVNWDCTAKGITDTVFCNALEEILSNADCDFTYQTDGLFMITDEQQMEELYIAYENCHVATVNMGYMGKINGKWCITTYISPDQHNSDGSSKPYLVCCYTIPEKYHGILEKYF